MNYQFSARAKLLHFNLALLSRNARFRRLRLLSAKKVPESVDNVGCGALLLNIACVCAASGSRQIIDIGISDRIRDHMPPQHKSKALPESPALTCPETFTFMWPSAVWMG